MKRASKILGLVAVATVLSVPSTQARTWYVNVGGTGDAPTIWAAMDSAAAGDTVLVGPGEYVITYQTDKIDVKAAVCLKSERGPLETRLISDGIAWWDTGIHLRSGAALDGFWAEGPFPWLISTGPNGRLTGCIVLGKTGISGSPYVANNLFLGALDFFTGGVDFQKNIVYGHMICRSGSGDQVNYFFCNDILGDVDPCIVHPTLFSNFSLDPQFCGIEGSENYYLRSSSPCAPGNTPPGGFTDCGLIGPLPVGCGVVRAEETSWGRVKALYGE